MSTAPAGNIGPIPVPDPLLALSPAGTAAAAATGAADALGNAIPGVGALQDAAAALTDPNVWKRIGVMVLGVYLTYVGVILWVASTDTARGLVKSAAGIATTAVPGGGAVKAATTAAASKIGA